MNSRRAKRRHRGFSGTRFARIELLESRIALDGSAAELGRIDADDAAVIRFQDRAAFESDISAFVASTDGNVHMDGIPKSILVDDMSTFADADRFDRFHNRNGYTSYEIGNQPIVALNPGDRVVIGLEQIERAGEDLLGSNQGLGTNLNHDGSSDRGLQEVSASDVSKIASDSQAEVADRIPLDDPAVISVPNPFGEFLPVETIANTDVNPGSILDASERGTLSPQRTHAGLSRAAATHVRPVTAISSDQYFADHEDREPFGWSTQSAASQSRQHVQPTPRSQQTTVSIKLGSDSTRTVDLLFGSTDQVFREAGWDEVLVSTGAKGNSDITPRAQGVSIATDDVGQLTSEPKGVWPQTAIDDLLFVRSQPLAIVVGISLVSAHLVSDARSNNRRSLELGVKKRKKPQNPNC